MRRGLIIGCVGALVVVGCSGGDGGSSAEQLREEPTAESCRDAAERFFDRIEVPVGFDPSNGVDDAELVVARSAVDIAAQGLYDPSDIDHPCTLAIGALPPDELEELLGSIDPGVVEMLNLLMEG
jgi:hypothetical protein